MFKQFFTAASQDAAASSRFLTQARSLLAAQDVTGYGCIFQCSLFPLGLFSLCASLSLWQQMNIVDLIAVLRIREQEGDD